MPNGSFEKLVANVFDKIKHVIHYENLQRYLRLRMNLKETSHIQ